MIYNEFLLRGGDISFDIISFIRETRTKYQLKQKLNLYIDLINDFKPLDIILCQYESVLIKMGNLNKVDYSLYTLLENGSFFSAKNISGYNIYIELPGIEVDINYEDEIARLTKQRDSINTKLSNHKFLEKAPIEIIDGEKSKLNYIDKKIQSLINIKLLLLNGLEYYDMLYKYGYNWITYKVQELRIDNEFDEYSKEWFDYVYSDNITSDEIKSLCTNRISEHSSVAEELFENITDLEEKCLAIEESVSEGYFSLEEALKNYGVNQDDYTSYKNKKTPLI